MLLFWRVAALAWLDEMLRNFLWVPLTAHAKALGYNTSFLAPIFAENVGARFLPNLLVTQVGAKTELPMMFSVLCGYVLSFCFPAKPWAFHALAVAAGLGFMRPCVTLHSQAVCKGDMRALTQLSQQCGAARTFADVCSFVLPAALYDFVGWAGVSLFGVALAFCYLVLAVPMHASNDGMTASLSESVLGSFQLKRIYWIDWILSGAFVSTELQWNMLNTAVPAALVTTFAFPTYAVGAVLGSGAFVAMCFLLVLPSLPRCFNQPRPTNLLVSYTFMSMSWLFMSLAFAPSLAPPIFVVGVWAFLSMANASQVVLMECLTGVNDVETSGQIMGISEMLGCAVGMLGSYAGAMLFAVAPVAPFLGCGAAALGCTLFLCLALGVRRVEVHKRLSDKADPGSLISDLELSQDSTSLVEESVQGLGMIMRDGERAHSYIGPEVAHRAHSEGSPATSPASSASPPYASRRGVTIPGHAMDS